jgi:signal transduction histidine kinase
MELRSDQPPDDRKAILRMIENAVNRGSEIINRLREYIRGGTGEQTAVDVRKLMEEALDLTRPLWRRDERIVVITEFSPVAPVKANAADLRRVFTNLILNAIQAMPEGGRLTLHCEQQQDRVVCWVRDTGIGIPASQQKNIFLPYFTTKPHGTGLGLSGAQKIVVSQHGNIRFHSEPGEGTTFTVELPVMAEKPQTAKVA